MKTIRLSEIPVDVAAKEAAEVLRRGGVVLYPTDTLYGLGADALSDQAIRKVQQVKGREEKKPIHAIVANIEMAAEYAIVTEEAKILAEKFWPGALTMILKKKPQTQSGIAKEIDTFGVRVPNNEFCLALARAFGKPYTTTSANKSGEESKRSIPAILEQLGKGAEHIDLIINGGTLPSSLPSTIVDIHAKGPMILREGAISSVEVWEVLHEKL